MTHLVASVGTGGTISGAAHYLRDASARMSWSSAPTRRAASCPATPSGRTSRRASARTSSRARSTRRWSTAGSGSRDHDAFAMARRITREEGILAGESCGTALVAAREVVRELTARAPDRRGGRRHPSRRRPVVPVQALQRRVDAQPRAAETPGGVVRVGELLRAGTTARSCPMWSSRGRPIGSATAIDQLQRFGISQLPVSEAPEGDDLAAIVGSVSEKGLLDRAYREPRDRRAHRRRSHGPATAHAGRRRAARRGVPPAVRRCGGARSSSATSGPAGVVTKLDLLEFLAHLPGDEH